MVLFDWLFGGREVPDRAQVEFDHRKVFGEVRSGPGPKPASQAAWRWMCEVRSAFERAEAELRRVLRTFDVVMQGAAGKQAKEAVTPLVNATRRSIDVAAQVGVAVEQQAQGSADFKNGFPPPHEVPPDDIGWADYVNPVSYAAKSGVRAAHEVVHAEVEERARQQYESYARASNERVASMPRFAPPPKFDADVVAAPTAPVPRVRPEAGRPPSAVGRNPGGDPRVPPPRGAAPEVADPSGADPAPQRPAPEDPAADVPAESEAAWAAPAAADPAPPAGAAPGVASGGVAVPPGSGESSGGGVSGAGGRAGTGRGAGPGGRSGVGGSRSGGAGAGARGGGVAGGGAPAGRRRRSDEDAERTGKYLVATGEAWADLELPRVAPPVFGDWSAVEDKPPRPPEDD